MVRCEICLRPIDTYADSALPASCPHCRSPLPAAPAEQSQWLSVARVTNLAEAGYLVSDLSDQGVEGRIVQSEDFSVLTGSWNVSFLIQVAPEDAQKAAERIRTHVESEEAQQYSYLDGEPLQADEAADALRWRGIALLVLGGMAGFVLGHRFSDRTLMRDTVPTRNSLAATVQAIDRPFVSEPRATGPQHRLYYRSRQRSWFLETDADRDGQFEQRLRFDQQGARR